MSKTEGISAGAAVVVYDLADALTQFQFWSETKWCQSQCGEPLPAKVDVQLDRILQRTGDLVRLIKNKKATGLAKSLGQSAASAWEQLKAAWQGESHRACLELLEAADPEFEHDLARSAIGKSPIGSSAWADLKHQTAEMRAALPAALGACFRLSTLLTGELFPTMDREDRVEQLHVSELRYLTVVLDRELKELLSMLGQAFPQLRSLDCDLYGKSERRALDRISRLYKAIPRRLKAAEVRVHGQKEKKSDAGQGQSSAAESDKMAGELTFLPGAFTYRGHQHDLRGKPLQVLQALYQAPGRTLTLVQLQDKLWADTSVGEEAIRSAVKMARKALRKAMHAAEVRGPEDPIPHVDRGPKRTAWRLELP